jgi:hypothetical protein
LRRLILSGDKEDLLVNTQLQSQNANAAGQVPLQVRLTPIDTLKPDPANPRRHSPKQIRQLANSVETFGFNVPLLIDGNGQVIAGHGRLAACRRLGWVEVPCIRVDHLSETQRRAYVIADNRLSEVATWDDRLLARELAELSKVELNFDIETIGFDMGEIDLRIESLGSETIAGAANEPQIPGIESAAVTHIGMVRFWTIQRPSMARRAHSGSDCWPVLLRVVQFALALQNVRDGQKLKARVLFPRIFVEAGVGGFGVHGFGRLLKRKEAYHRRFLAVQDSN